MTARSITWPSTPPASQINQKQNYRGNRNGGLSRTPWRGNNYTIIQNNYRWRNRKWRSSRAPVLQNPAETISHSQPQSQLGILQASRTADTPHSSKTAGHLFRPFKFEPCVQPGRKEGPKHLLSIRMWLIKVSRVPGVLGHDDGSRC